MHTQPDIHMPIGPRVKTYIALLTQDSTATPTAYVLENTIGTVTLARANTGEYTVTVNGNFDPTKTTYIIGPTSTAIYTINADIEDPGVLHIFTIYNPTGSSSDGVLYKTPIEIRIYQ